MDWLIVPLEWIFGFATVGVLAPYAIYPLSLWILTRLYHRQHERDDSTPPVTLIISAFNEADVIEEKVNNALSLDYPKELLEILVISDGSDDGTDEIVASFRSRGVKLCRQEDRKGKSRGLTRFVPEASGTLIVFSDANSMYDRAAVRKLVRHFADPQVGYAVGHQRFYVDDANSVADSESIYWNLEVWLKELESRLSSVVGGDGAIYAIRKSLFTPLGDEDINDFLNPLQIVSKGFRGIFDREAFCYEHSARSFGGEFRRKARIVNRSLQAVRKVPSVLNPFRCGWFAYQLLFHKVLRWFMPYFLILVILSSSILAVLDSSWIFTTSFSAVIVFGTLCSIYAIPGARRFRPVYLAWFFLIGNIAALVGSFRLFRGHRIVTWTPERESQ